MKFTVGDFIDTTFQYQKSYKHIDPFYYEIIEIINNNILKVECLAFRSKRRREYSCWDMDLVRKLIKSKTWILVKNKCVEKSFNEWLLKPGD